MFFSDNSNIMQEIWILIFNYQLTLYPTAQVEFLWNQVTIWSIFCGVRLLLKDTDNFGEMLFHFKTKYLKPCSGFKPIAYKVLSFPQKCVKGCPTIVQLKIISFPPQAGENQCFQIWKCYFHDYTDLRNRNFLRNLKSNTTEYMK